MSKIKLAAVAVLVSAGITVAGFGQSASALAPTDMTTACNAFTTSASSASADRGRLTGNTTSAQSYKVLNWKYDTTYTAGKFCLTSGATSTGKQAYLYFQKDGNLVLYSQAKVAQWASNTHGRGATVKFQSDRNIVIYDAANKPIWASMNTNSVPRNGTKLATQDGQWSQNFAAAANNVQPDWYYSTFRPAFSKNQLTLVATNVTNPAAPTISIDHKSSWQSDWDANNTPIPTQTLWYGGYSVQP